MSDSTTPSSGRPPTGWPPDARTKAQLDADIRRHGRCILVVNTRSRRGRRRFTEVCRRLEAAGIHPLKVLTVSEPGTLGDTLDEAIRHEVDLLVVGGGDGTLAEAANHLAYRDIGLGVLPLGTTNNFARSLGIPLDLPGAIRTLAEGKVADVDLGRTGERLFPNLTSLGVSLKVAEQVRPGLKRRLGRLAYALTALRALPAHEPFRARITTGDEVYEFETHQLNIANGSFHSGRPIAHDASVDDRLLVVYRLGESRRTHLITETVRQMLGGPRRTITGEPFLTTDDLYLETDPPLTLDIDGEVSGQTPVHITLEPNALRVMVQQDFVDT